MPGPLEHLKNTKGGGGGSVHSKIYISWPGSCCWTHFIYILNFCFPESVFRSSRGDVHKDCMSPAPLGFGVVVCSGQLFSNRSRTLEAPQKWGTPPGKCWRNGEIVSGCRHQFRGALQPKLRRPHSTFAACPGDGDASAKAERKGAISRLHAIKRERQAPRSIVGATLNRPAIVPTRDRLWG